MGAGRIIAIIGGIVGILSIVLYHVMPEIFCLWKFDAEVQFDVTMGGFAFQGLDAPAPFGYDPEFTESLTLLIVVILIVAGGAIAILGGLINNKLVGILGGIAMLGGMVAFMIGLVIEFGKFGDLSDGIALFFPSIKDGLLYGSTSTPASAGWGLWIGSYMAIGGGVAGLIGGLLID